MSNDNNDININISPEVERQSEQEQKVRADLAHTPQSVEEVVITREEETKKKVDSSHPTNQINFNQMQQNLMTYLKVIQDSCFSNDQASIQLFAENIPQNIQKFLCYNLLQYSIEEMKIVFTFFVNYIQIRCNHFDSMPNNEFNWFWRVFEPLHQFYFNSNNCAYDKDFFEYFLMDVFPVPQNYEVAPNILRQEFKNMNPLINYFYKYLLTFIQNSNLFTAAIQYMTTPPARLEIEKLVFMFQHLIQIFNYYEEMDLSVIIEVAKAVNGYFEALLENNGLKDVNKTYIESYLKQHMFLAYSLFEKLHADESLEQSKIFKTLLFRDLDMIYFLLFSNNLERRVMGIKALNDAISVILQFEKTDQNKKNINNISNLPFLVKLTHIRKQHLLDWLDKINIFNLIFGENMHEALLNKSSLILIFLYVNDRLSFEKIDLIWKVAADKHEAISASILNIFSDLISSLSIDHAMHILKEINEIPFKEVNNVTIKILDSFSNNKYLSEHKQEKPEETGKDSNQTTWNNDALNAGLVAGNEFELIKIKSGNGLDFLLKDPLMNDAKEIDDFKAYFLKILWRFSSENSFYSGLSPQIILKARKSLSLIVLNPIFKKDLAKYLKKCIIGIGYNHKLTTCLSVLDMILKNMKKVEHGVLKEILSSSFGQDVTDYKSFLSYLEKQYSIVPLLLHAIINLKNEVMIISGEIINLQTDFAEEGTNNMSDVLNNFEIKFQDPNNQIFKNLKEETKEFDISSRETNVMINYDGIEMTNKNENLDETLSTEKSADDSVSSVSTDVSSLEKSRMFIVKEFIESNLHNNKNIPYLGDNYHIIFKRLKLNFANSNYYSIVNMILDFVKNTLFSSSISITQTQIEFLFTLLVENAVDEDEMNLFYTFFAELFRYQHLTKQSVLSEENFNLILFDILLKIELSSLPYSAFNLFKQIFFFVNSVHGTLIIVGQNIADVRDFSQLVGFETLWKFYIETNNINISNDSQNLLVNLISTMAKREDNKESFLFIFDKIFENLDFYYTRLNMEKLDINNNMTETFDVNYEERTNKLINLLFIINSARQKFEKQVEEITLGVHNYHSGDGRKVDLKVGKDTKLKDLRTIILTKILCPQTEDNKAYTPLIDEKSLMLMSKGRILNRDELTLRCLKLDNGSKIQVFKGGDSSGMEVQIDEDRLNMMVLDIKSAMEHLEDEVIKRALKKYNYDVNETFMALTDDMIVADIRVEIQEENTLAMNDVQSKFGVELFNEAKIELLISLLDLEIVSLNNNIWQLLSAIKFPDTLINSLIEVDSVNFEQILNASKPNHMLLFLRIINCFIFNDNYLINVGKLDEGKRSEWKMNMLISEGVSQLIDSVERIVEKVLKLNPEANYSFIYAYVQSLQIISKWLHYFTFSSALSHSTMKENLSLLIKQIIHKRPVGVHVGVPVQSPPNPGNATPAHSNSTPTFGSPKSSLSADKNAKVIRNLSVLGAEEYENNYEEDIANSFFVRMISCNFHMSIIKFITFASKQEILNSLYRENEAAYICLFEILMVLNEVNPESFKDIMSIEYDNSYIINLLFIEKSKFVRKVVENLFIIFSQSKSNDQVVQSGSLNIPSLKTTEGSQLKYSKDIIMLHVLNNYKRIFSGQVYEEFYNLFGFMLIHSDEKKIVAEDFNVSTLTLNIINVIMSLSLRYDIELNEIEQDQLNGNIYLFQCLCASNENTVIKTMENFTSESNTNLINFFYRNLFIIEGDTSTDYNPRNIKFKYSQKNLRQKVYNLLISLLRLNEGHKKDLAVNLISHHVSFKNNFLGNVDLDIPLRTKNDKFIGLKNYGATCYLNSLIQQLYMIPGYRNGIYSVPILENRDIFQDLDKNPLYQLQCVFANLTYSVRQFHLPMHFIQSFVNAFNGEPINVFKQQDCLEFFLILNDQIEDIAKQLNKDHILDDSIRGKIIHETISLENEFPYYSQREEPFLSISLDIKNKKSLEEAFDSFVKPEIVDGENKYHCEQYNKKISIMRRVSIKKLPPHFIINLKRFEIDYNTFERNKLNDYCEFPTVIDFRTWTRGSIVSQNKDDPNYKNLDIQIDDEEEKELADPEAYKYQLTGVLVQSGSIDAGHYYSFIYDIQSGRWFKYNDFQISDFNINDLKSECFGDDNPNGDAYSKSNNAYLLFYTKISQISKYNTQDAVPVEILQQIKNENTLFLKYKNYLDSDYFNFMRDFLDFSIKRTNKFEKLSSKEKSMSRIDRITEEITHKVIQEIKTRSLDSNKVEDLLEIKEIFIKTQNEMLNYYSNQLATKDRSLTDKNLNKKIIKLGMYYYFDVIIQQKEIHRTNMYANFVRELLESDRNCAAWFLRKFVKYRNLFVEFVLANNQSDVREGISRIIINCFHCLYNDEERYLKEKFEVLRLHEESGTLTMTTEYRSVIMRFFKNNLLDLFDNTRLFWNQYAQFMQIIYELINNNFFEIIELSVQENLMMKVIYMVMNNQKNYETNYPTIGSKTSEPNFSICIDILSSLILSCVTKGIYAIEKYSPHSIFQSNKHMIKLPENVLFLLGHKEVIIDNILKKYQNENTNKMIHHMCWGDKDISFNLINYVTTSVKENLKDVRALINLINNSYGIISIDDKFRMFRLKAFFCLDDVSEIEHDSIFNYLVSYRDENSFGVLICLKLLGEMINKYPHAFEYVLTYNTKLEWIYFFLKDINSNNDKTDTLQIDAATEGYSYLEVIGIIEEIYLNKLKIKNYVKPTVINNAGTLNNDNYMLLDYEQEIQDINNQDVYNINGNQPN